MITVQDGRNVNFYLHKRQNWQHNQFIYLGWIKSLKIFIISLSSYSTNVYQIGIKWWHPIVMRFSPHNSPTMINKCLILWFFLRANEFFSTLRRYIVSDPTNNFYPQKTQEGPQTVSSKIQVVGKKSSLVRKIRFFSFLLCVYSIANLVHYLLFPNGFAAKAYEWQPSKPT